MSRSISLAADAFCAGNCKIDDSRLARPSPLQRTSPSLATLAPASGIRPKRSHRRAPVNTFDIVPRASRENHQPQRRFTNQKITNK